jgi:hypothetical protein
MQLDDTRRVRYIRARATDGSVLTLASLAKDNPRQILAGPDSTIYLLNDSNIRKIAQDGGSTVLAGDSAHPGNADGSGTAARFTWLYQIAADRSGNLYVLDQHTLRRVSPTGVVTTLARLGTTDIENGSTASARLEAPQSLAVDASGNILLIDRVVPTEFDYRKLSYSDLRQVSAGEIKPLVRVRDPMENSPLNVTLRGATPDRLLRIGASGALLVASKGLVGSLGLDCKRLVVAGQVDGNDQRYGRDGGGGAARFSNPGMLAADRAGNVYSIENASDAGGVGTRLVMRKTTEAGVVSTVLDMALNDAAVPGSQIGVPSGLAVDAAGRIWLSAKQMPYGGAVYQVGAGDKLTLVAGQQESATPR